MLKQDEDIDIHSKWLIITNCFTHYFLQQVKEPSMSIPIPSQAATTTASQMSGGTNAVPSTAAQEHGVGSTTTTAIPNSQSVSKAEPVDTTTSAQLQEIELQIQSINSKLKSLRTEREKLESGGTEEQHKQAMNILEQEQTLERQHKEALFRQKQITNKQTNTETKQKLGEPTTLQSQQSHKCYKLALRLRYVYQ